MDNIPERPGRASGSSVLKISGLEKHYGPQTVFSDLSLELTDGEIVAVTGPSGSGKTTLLNLVAGLDQPNSGDISVDGQSLSQLDEQQRTLLRRRSIGFIFQFFNLIPTLTVAENCCLPLELNNMEQHRQQVLAQLEEVGLQTKAQQFPEQLSGGEQQRVAIIRALAHRPTLILADEPTGNLDQHSAELMGDFLYQRVKQHRCALLLVTHSKTLAAKADRRLQL